MNNTSPEGGSQSVSVARAVRFGFATVVLGLSYPNIQCARRLHAFEQVFRDMLGDKPLPAVTTFILHAQPALLGLSILFPILAVVLVFIPRLAQSIYVSGVLILLTFFQLFFTWHAVSEPLFSIIQGMSGGQQ